jgi:polyribonucleotide nucleotidyltransferase
MILEMIKALEKTFELSDGRKITLETGKLAKQADGSVVVKMGRTMLLATVVSAKEAGAEVDYMPLSVDYKEKFAAMGRFPGGFMKRESKPSDYEILVARLVDRALRPLFPENYHADTFVNVMLISGEKDTIPDALAGLAASAAMMVSGVPFNGPISEVRIGRVNGNFIVNPTYSELTNSDMDIMVAATMDNIMMVEGEMKEVSEADMLEAIKLAHASIKVQCQAQLDLQKMVNKPIREYNHEVNDEDLKKYIWDKTYQETYKIGRGGLSKHERNDAFEKIHEGLLTELVSETDAPAKKVMVNRYYHEVQKQALRNLILDEGVRVDGRKTNEIRPIWGEVDYIPAAHGSAIFTRGETQSLTTVTLGNKLNEKMLDEVMFQGSEKFTLHYNFPPFSTGDAKSSRGISRREIGHGNLALRALKGVIPHPPGNPYAIRVVSDILESNGSSSMATVCAGTLALMDAGIKILRPVSGIAMGLISKEGKFAILSDILGDEDHLGDMDFKVAGTDKGITATQMDIKVEGLSYEVMAQALEQARVGRMHILGKILEVIPAPRPDLKPHAPRIVQISIPKELIGALIGPGGKVVQEIQKTTGATIVIQEVDNFGVVDIFSDNKEAIDAALERVNAITEVPEVDKIYHGTVKSIVPFGAFVEIMPGKEGLLHISEIAWRRLERADEVLKEGEKVDVKLLEVDKKTGKLKLSRKVLIPREPGEGDQPEGEKRERHESREHHEPREHREPRKRPS